MKVYIFISLLLFHFRIVSIAVHDFNLNDSPPSENDQIVSSEQLSLPNKALEARASEKDKEKRKRVTKRRRSPEYYGAILEKTERKLNEAKEKLEEARKTGIGSLIKPKMFAQTHKAVREKQKRDQRAKVGGLQYEEYLKVRRETKKAKWQALTPQQKEVQRAKKRAREQKKRDWFKLPGNEAEREAETLRNRANFNRFHAKTKN